MSEENRAVVQRLIEDVINARNVDALSEVYAEDCVLHGHPSSRNLGRNRDLPHSERKDC